MHQAPSIVYQIPFAFIALVSLAGSGHLLGRANSRHLYVLTYMASLFVCLAGLVAIFAHYTAAFDSAGTPKNITGYTVLWLLKSLIDFETEVFVLTASAIVIVIPPVFSYLITGLYGFAVWKMFFRPVLRYLVFSFVKFLVGYSIITIIFLPGIFRRMGRAVSKHSEFYMFDGGYTLQLRTLD